MTILKGYITIVTVLCFCALSSVYAQQRVNVTTPFVMNASDVPVLGGVLNIYGLHFGNDSSVIKVYIVDTPSISTSVTGISVSRIIPCVDVEVVVADSIISCSVFDIGTGKAKRIEVIVDGVSNAFTDDSNYAFSRSAPVMELLTYNDDDSGSVKVYGRHFGFNPTLVSVSVDGYDHIVTSVNDTVITCNKHADYEIPYTGINSIVAVVVDNQKSVANISFVTDAILSGTDPVVVDNSEGVQGNITSFLQLSNKLIIIIALVAGVGIILLVTGFVVIKKRKTANANKRTTSTVDAHKQITELSNAIITTANIMVRDQSMEEIDLKADLKTELKEDTLATHDSLYEVNDVEYSSSSSSFSSPYSSNNSTPSFCTPESMRREGGASSPAFTLAEVQSRARDHSISKRERSAAKKLSMCMDMHDPVSRLEQRSMDSPYFAKQNAFDSPMNTSQCNTPKLNHKRDQNDLHSSQEINQQRANVFDSPSVLHAAIQRAAVIRGASATTPPTQPTQQQPTPPHHKPISPALHLINKARGRRASLGAYQQNAERRRSSLCTTSLHTSALHSSVDIPKHITEEEQPQPQSDSPRATQVIHKHVNV